jgi:hypothetical protein
MTTTPNTPRLPDWPMRLHALVVAATAKPFAWGAHDCCTWAADAVQAITGIDHAADLRGTYSTQAQAGAVLAQHGGLRGVAGRAGPAIRPLFARPGDVGLLRDGTPKLAVCAGDCWLVVGTHGLVRKPLQDAALAWGVGHG